MGFNDLEIHKIEKIFTPLIETRRPHEGIRDKVDLAYKIENQSIIIYEIRPAWDNPNEILNFNIAKATYIKSKNYWKLFWKRSDLKWHSYEPCRTVDSPKEFFDVVNEDAYCCFWG